VPARETVFDFLEAGQEILSLSGSPRRPRTHQQNRRVSGDAIGLVEELRVVA
jgi:hypothetical protein